MASDQYKKLIDELCKLTALPPRASYYERADLQVDKVLFALAEAEPGESKQAEIVIFCDFGAPPRTQRELVLQKLLELNLSLQGRDLPVMSMNAENGHVLLCRRLPLAGLGALDLLNKMKDHAGQAKQWRNEGCFLEDGGSKGAARKSDGARRQLLRFQQAA